MPAPERPRKPTPLPPETVDAVADTRHDTVSEAELLERLEEAVRLLPPAERRAVMAAHASEDGVAAVAALMDLSDEDADALTRSAVQLLRGALADLEPGPSPDFGSMTSTGVTPMRRTD